MKSVKLKLLNAGGASSSVPLSLFKGVPLDAALLLLPTDRNALDYVLD